jgi:FkbM family methyltransferase
MPALRNLLPVLAARVPEPIKRFCRQRGWRPGRSAIRLFDYMYEPDVRKFMCDTVRSGDTCIDVGANDGIHTALMAKLVGPKGLVVAYEAHPGIAATLREYVARKPWRQRVRVEAAAVSDGSTATVSLYPGPGEGPMQWSIIAKDAEAEAASPEVVVPAVALDTAFPDGERVDFVKIDAEGAGAGILAGMRGVIVREHPTFFVEVHSDAELAAVEGLASEGYMVHRTDGKPPERPRGAAYVEHIVALPPSGARKSGGS